MLEFAVIFLAVTSAILRVRRTVLVVINSIIAYKEIVAYAMTCYGDISNIVIGPLPFSITVRSITRCSLGISCLSTGSTASWPARDAQRTTSYGSYCYREGQRS